MAKKLSRRVLAAHVGDALLAGQKKSAVLGELAGYLIESKRTKEIDLIVQDIEYYLSTRGTVVAKVTSAYKLGDATKKQIEKMIAGSTAAKNISLHESVDHTVLGGIRLSIPGRELDNTIARKLATLRTNYKKA